ncbi:hypothetical protein [Capnocytophaga sp. oral taxon 338]|uniref:hypothetical protein n=1 Tax=Capnocytophaga sp. oral taxon 338 TaxID=710239 RepID=UPI000202ED2E|nr:hypothetical protein [Capnocytophaga sp. oral taxon 338]EGD34233.1 hypothetical protein HMPREF9071_1168 [Capnocytophaga sp. oral taxon 338 str. F0234]
MENKKPHFGRVFVVSFLLYILYFGIIDTIDTSIDNKLFFLLISPAFLVLGILTYYAFYYDIAKYMLFFFIIIAMLYLSITLTLVVGVLIYFSFFYKSEKVRKIAKIGLFISGFFAIPLIASFFGYNSLYNYIAKTFSNMTLPSKYEKYVALSGNTVSYEGNTMKMLPEGENKLIEFAFVNQKNELIISDDEPLGYLSKYDTQGNRIDTLKIEKVDGIDNLFDGFYGDYLMDFKGKRYCSWAIDGNKSFQSMEQLSDYEKENIIDDDKMLKGKRMDLFSYKDENIPKEESQRREKIIPQYFKVESSGSNTSSGIGGGSISYRTTWEEGILFLSIEVNGKTFHLKKGMTMFDEENLLKSSTIYRTISGGTLEQYENYQVYTHPKWNYALFAYKNYRFSNVYRLFIIKNKKG